MYRPYEEQAKEFINAIKAIANKPNNLENLESYLSIHFQVWLEKYANTPENMVSELKEFMSMNI